RYIDVREGVRFHHEAHIRSFRALESCLVPGWPHHCLLLVTRGQAARQLVLACCGWIRPAPSTDGERRQTVGHLVASERQVPRVRAADLRRSMGPDDPADGGQRLGLEGASAATCVEQERSASCCGVFRGWTVARIYVERI